MTRYLKPGPFSLPTSNGRMTDLEYAIAVGNVVHCPTCGEYVKPDHKCPELHDAR